MKKTRFLTVLLVLTLLFSLTACSNGIFTSSTSGDGSSNPGTSASGNSSDYHTDGKPIVTMEIANYGKVVIELYPDIAPITVANFVSLVSEGYYDGNNFHRLVKGFMLQGGDPTATGMGGSSKTIKGEFASNGVKNDLKHEAGVISMARSSNPNSASSQFFIMFEAAPHLDGDYAAFGKVIEGFENIKKIEANEPQSDRLANPIKIVKATVELNGYVLAD
ncbi:MAG: peptidylprolyl isomerase [Clostridia bacterium]|nr:peptidylprolyl isomerase [Clostridia bacterium]